MRVLLQRAAAGSVTISGECVGKIGKGLVLLIGVTHTDTPEDVDYLVKKCANLRIFEDENGKMNRSLLDINGEVLAVSQFTLYGDCVKGRRPGFDAAAEPVMAEKLYDLFVEKMKQEGVRKVDTGRFGADMMVSIENDGPVTFMLESKAKS
ncbi:MAG: D-tyrosyl-tRNA(Tyr) deacylase [Lentisphaeria bacterium]|nr:D-tyrosyl-tRNA(Tyr) deacylase [Lentisphaeria bacterium]